MAKVKGPLFSQEAEGSLGGLLTFRDGPAGPRVSMPGVLSAKSKASPSAAQVEQRTRYRLACDAWAALTDQERAGWSAEARVTGRNVTGFNLFLASTVPVIEEPPPPPPTKVYFDGFVWNSLAVNYTNVEASTAFCGTGSGLTLSVWKFGIYMYRTINVAGRIELFVKPNSYMFDHLDATKWTFVQGFDIAKPTSTATAFYQLTLTNRLELPPGVWSFGITSAGVKHRTYNTSTPIQPFLSTDKKAELYVGAIVTGRFSGTLYAGRQSRIEIYSNTPV